MDLNKPKFTEHCVLLGKEISEEILKMGAVHASTPMRLLTATTLALCFLLDTSTEGISNEEREEIFDYLMRLIERTRDFEDLVL